MTKNLSKQRPIALAGFALVLQVLGGTTAARAQEPFGPWGAAVSVDLDSDVTRGVNTVSNDGCPIEAPDGHSLFIASSRPGGKGLNDIWVASRASMDHAWGEPVNLAPINSAAQDFCPTPLPGNRLLFVSTRANNCMGPGNNADIYYTEWHPVRGWLEPQPLSCDVNSGFAEFSPSLVHTHGKTMLFFSSDRNDPPPPPAGGPHKIYTSELLHDGTWSPAMPVDELNAPGASDARPNVRRDGLEIVFDSNRGGGAPDIYTSSRASIYDAWSAPVALDINVNLPSGETRPTISHDGRRLYFGSNRAGGSGDFDVYVSKRRIGANEQER